MMGFGELAISWPVFIRVIEFVFNVAFGYIQDEHCAVWVNCV